MIGTITKLVAYKKAPKTTFSVRHPRRAVQMKKMQYDFRHAYAPRIAAVGAAAVALPVGFWLGWTMHANGHGEEL